MIKLYQNLAIVIVLSFLASCSKSGSGKGGSIIPEIGPTESIGGEGEEVVTEAPEEEKPKCKMVDQIINGSFEEGHDLSEDKAWAVYSTIPGWQLDLSESDAPFELQYKDLSEIKARKGSIKLELDSHNKDGFTESDASIFQEIQTVKDQAYRLEFFYAAKTTSVTSSTVDVFWNDKLVLSISGGEKKWVKIKTKLVGIDGISTLKFKAKKDTDTVGAFLDAVSLKTKVCQ